MLYRTVIVDRSMLAVNMYRLLLKPWGSLFLVAKRYEEARPWFFRKDKIDLAIFNSNTFGKKFDEYFDHFSHDEPLAKVPKVFLCKEGEKAWGDKLRKSPRAKVLVKPFHPDEFLKIIDNLCKERSK